MHIQWYIYIQACYLRFNLFFYIILSIKFDTLSPFTFPPTWPCPFSSPASAKAPLYEKPLPFWSCTFVSFNPSSPQPSLIPLEPWPPEAHKAPPREPLPLHAVRCLPIPRLAPSATAIADNHPTAMHCGLCATSLSFLARALVPR